jgi:DNA-binding transcriptional ArsR family regulator
VTYEASLIALADPTRRAILERLRRGPLHVGEIARDLPVSRAAVSQHLRVLKKAQLVSDEADGTKRIYRVEPRGLEELQRYLEQFRGDVMRAYADRSKKRRRSK